jgi:hypothetical protein
MLDGSVHYIPQLTTNYTQNLDSDKVYYYRRDLKSTDVQAQNQYSKNSKGTPFVSGVAAEINKPGGAIFIRASLYKQYFIGTSNEPFSPPLPPGDPVNPSAYVNKEQAVNPSVKTNSEGKLECTIYRYGIAVKFTEDTQKVVLTLPQYDIKESKAGWSGWIDEISKKNIARYPTYQRNIDDSTDQFEVIYYCGFECTRASQINGKDDLFIPLHALAYTLGSNMFYYTWQQSPIPLDDPSDPNKLIDLKNSDNVFTTIAKHFLYVREGGGKGTYKIDQQTNKLIPDVTYIRPALIDPGCVGAIVWDQRVRSTNDNEFGTPNPFKMDGNYIQIMKGGANWRWKIGLKGNSSEQTLNYDQFFVAPNISLRNIACPHFSHYIKTLSDVESDYVITSMPQKEAFFIVAPFGGLPRLLQRLYDLVTKEYSARYSQTKDQDFTCSDGCNDNSCARTCKVTETPSEGKYLYNKDNLILRCPEYNDMLDKFVARVSNYSTHTLGRAGDIGFIKMKKAGISMMYDCHMKDLERVAEVYNEPAKNMWQDGRSNGIKWNEQYLPTSHFIKEVTNLFADQLSSLPYRHYFYDLGSIGQPLPPPEQRPLYRGSYYFGLMRMEYKEEGSGVTWNHSEVYPLDFGYSGPYNE